MIFTKNSPHASCIGEFFVFYFRYPQYICIHMIDGELQFTYTIYIQVIIKNHEQLQSRQL